MLTIRSLLALGLLAAVEALPGPQLNPRARTKATTGGGKQKAQTAFQQAQQIPQGISTATDGSTILDTTAQVNGLPLRFKISGPADQFTADSGVDGATQAANATGSLGLNVLLHGDGGQSFFDFPNQAVQANLAGVAVLAPDPNLFWGGGSGLERTDGVAHAQAVNDLVQNVLPQVMAFNASNVFFTGVSGGSLMLSGFFVPAHMTNFQGNGVLLNCGGLAPQVDFVDANAVVANTKIHFQSTQQELAELQQSIPQSVAAYEQAATDAGLSADQVGALQTVDNSPNGGHCEFDEKDFVSGVQLMADSFSDVMQGGTGQVNGVNVLNTVVGNENLQFSAAAS
ncbi:putative Cyclin-like f-box protein [Seiridium unicorne]|uniref:Cyclin-like f-box protein n=1 Tax=Seiridium unicorne TaxID=138068 RepID=A0ABR2UY32_9PEZI